MKSLQKIDKFPQFLLTISKIKNKKELIKYYEVKSNAPFIGDRDVVVREQSIENYPAEGQYVMAFTSVTHPAIP